MYLGALLAASVACESPGFGSNGGAVSLTSAKVTVDEKAVVAEVRERRDDPRPGPDERLYAAALEAERAPDFERAGALYHELLERYSESSYAAYAIFALGEMHLDGLESDADRLANALVSYRTILKSSGVSDELHALTLVRVAECADAQGDRDTAKWARDEVWKRFPNTRAAALVPHKY